MYSKIVVLNALDEYLITEGSLEHYELEPDIDDPNGYYGIRLGSLGLTHNNLNDTVTHLEDELDKEVTGRHNWRTVGDLCNAFVKRKKEMQC